MNLRILTGKQVGGLLFQQGIREATPLEGRVNVEELFNAVQLLAERNDLAAAPFVGSWHPVVQQFDRAQCVPPQFGRLYKVICEGVTRETLNSLPSHLRPFGDREIDQGLEQTIEKKVQSMAKSHGSFYSSLSIGRKVGDYVIQILKDWGNRLRNSSLQGSFDFEPELQQAIQ